MHVIESKKLNIVFLNFLFTDAINIIIKTITNTETLIPIRYGNIWKNTNVISSYWFFIFSAVVVVVVDSAVVVSIDSIGILRCT